jgi:hypothetical protein
MSKYQVTVTSTSRRRRRIVDVDEGPQQVEGNLGALDDVDTTDRGTGGNLGIKVLVWDNNQNQHVYLSPEQIVDISDNVDDDVLDYGTY